MWYDFFKVFTHAFEEDPQTKRSKIGRGDGAGITSPDAMPFVRQDGGMQSTGKGALRVGNDFVDLSSVSNRQSRYKEYERLRNVAEIEQAMTIIADEACIDGDELVNTLYDGQKSIKWLTENRANDEFFVYSWDFEKEDYTLAIAYEPRFVKKAPCLKILLDNGTYFIATHDHLVLLKNQAWSMTSGLKFGDELMPFYRVPANYDLTQNKKNQFPRIRTFSKGWVHERQFIDEWKTGKSIAKYEKVNHITRMIASGLSTRQLTKASGYNWPSAESWIGKEGFSNAEIKWLAKKNDHRKVIGIIDVGERDVYDLSVKEHENFCGESVIFHNCQKSSKGNVLEVRAENQDVREEVEFLLLNRKMLNFNRKIWGLTKRLCINGDWFGECIIDPDNPKDGILKVRELPPESIYRIETTKAKLLEFQQGNEGPDYEALTKSAVVDATDSELDQCKVIRFTPDQIVHMRLGEDRKTFYPYGQSLIEPARGPAHQLRLMEDAMVVYRLTRAPERRVFYIDVGQLPSFRAESFMTRMQDLLRKKKTANKPGDGSSAIDEKWSPPSADEDFWIPVRPNSNTRIETLPGAQNLGEIDDAVYFRNKLFTSLNFPSNYMANEDASSTRMQLSYQNVKFARMIERIQEHIEDGLWEIAERHLQLRGFPEESYEDLTIKLTLPSEYRELSRAEIDNNRINNANALKGSLLYSDWDILTKIIKLTPEDAEEMISRMKIQKLEEAKLQILVQNPQLMGVGMPGTGEPQMGSEAGGPNPMLPPEGEPDKGKPEDQAPGAEGSDGGAGMPAPNSPKSQNGSGGAIAEPEPEEIKRYDLEIQDYGQEMDAESPDYSEM